MDRRLALVALGCGGMAAWAQQPEQRPRHKVSAAQLHEALGARFPVHARLGRALELEVRAPRLLLLPERQKLGATLAVEAGGSQVQPPRTGEMDVVFALRFDGSDRSLRARDLEILELRWPDLSDRAARALRQLLPALARDAVGEFVLHRFTPGQLGLVDTLGYEPERFEVLDDGVLVHFAPKPGR